MIRVLTALLLIFPAILAGVEPEECLVTEASPSSVSIEHGGKTYLLASAECRDLFLSDPERYAQLFDAFAELGVGPSAPEPENVSLVPN